MFSCLRVLLLAVVLCAMAHAHILKYHRKDEISKLNVTSLLAKRDAATATAVAAAAATGDAAVVVALTAADSEGVSKNINKSKQSRQALSLQSARENLLSLEHVNSVSARTPLSVVQDWSLVCKQLCGADLAGPSCASYCTNIINLTAAAKEVQQQNAEALLATNKDLLCQELCELQLGDAACNCIRNTQAAVRDMATPHNRNAVCSVFCKYNKATLTGCSLCHSEETFGAATFRTDADADADADAAADDNDDDVSAVGEADAVLPPEQRSGAADTVETTTPNWNQLCVSLCKTGDGGSLCNCNLSPFF